MQYKCKLCGGYIDSVDGSKGATCGYCGQKYDDVTGFDVDMEGLEEKNGELSNDWDINQSVSVGKTVRFGKYELGFDVCPIEWIVLDKVDGKALIITKYGIDCKRFNETNTNVSWETSPLRKWLNSRDCSECGKESEIRIIYWESNQG